MGLVLYSLGAFLFIPAANAESFTFFRIALFILACGLATLETVAHPFVASLGDQRTSDQRINFAQSFNGLGAFVGPFIGGYFILRAGQEHSNDLISVKVLYMTIGFVILAIAVIFSFIKVPKLGDPHAIVEAAKDAYAVPVDPEDIRQPKKLFQNKHFIWAVVAQFFNVAAQGGTWAYFINYGHEKMGFTDEKASYYFGLSMIMMMVGVLPVLFLCVL
jgi:FHS family L-fucose permease-like MFS transporter